MIILDRFNQRQHVIDGDVGGYAVRWREDVAAIRTHDLQRFASFGCTLLGRCEGKKLLGADTAVEGDVCAVFFLQCIKIVDFGLDGVVDIHTHINEVVHDFAQVAAAMEHDVFARAFDFVEDCAHAGLYVFAPHIRTHDEAHLLTPVVAEIYGFVVVLQNEIEQL